jgi:hypothetical protein
LDGCVSGGKVGPSWSRDSLHSLYHYMRCSQLENQGHEACTTIQVIVESTESIQQRPVVILFFRIFFLKFSFVKIRSILGVTCAAAHVFVLSFLSLHKLLSEIHTDTLPDRIRCRAYLACIGLVYCMRTRN